MFSDPPVRDPIVLEIKHPDIVGALEASFRNHSNEIIVQINLRQYDEIINKLVESCKDFVAKALIKI